MWTGHIWVWPWMLFAIWSEAYGMAVAVCLAQPKRRLLGVVSPSAKLLNAIFFLQFPVYGLEELCLQYMRLTPFLGTSPSLRHLSALSQTLTVSYCAHVKVKPDFKAHSIAHYRQTVLG